MKLNKVRDWNIAANMPQSDTFTVSLRKLNGFILECERGQDGKAYFPADNCYLDVQRIGLEKKGKTLVNRVPLHVFLELSKLHYGYISNGSSIGAFVNLGSLFLDEKDELQVSLTYTNTADGSFYTIAEGQTELQITKTKPTSIRMKISTLDANTQIDHSLRYDKSKDYERPVNNVEAMYVYSEKLDKAISSQEFKDMAIQFNRVVGDDIIFDFSTACLASVIFNTVEDIEKQTVAQIYKNVDRVPSSGRIQMPLANDHKELTLLVVERITNAKAMVRQAKQTIKDENERLKSVARADEKDATALIVTGSVPAPDEADEAVKVLESVEKSVDKK